MTSQKLKTIIRISFDKLQNEQGISNFPSSAYFIKSLVRGDFVVGKSDIDILLIFQNNVSYEEQALFAKNLSDLLKNALKNNPGFLGHYHDCDILYLCEKEIPKNETDFLNSPFSIFTAFGFDLEANHELIAGNDILTSFVASNPTLFVDTQISRLLEKSDKEDLDVVLASGQISRLLLIKQGLKSLHKQEIRNFLENNENIELRFKNFAIKHFKYCYEDVGPELNFLNDCREFLVEVTK